MSAFRIYSFEELVADETSQNRVAAAGQRSLSYKDSPHLPPRSPAQKFEDGAVGELGELLTERLFNLKASDEKYQDHVTLDNVSICGLSIGKDTTLETKTLRIPNEQKARDVAEKHRRHAGKAAFVVVHVADRAAQTIYPWCLVELTTHHSVIHYFHLAAKEE